MIRGRTIICVASSWDVEPTSKHHIMSRLARENTVLWVNYHGTRKPAANAADLRSAFSVLGRVARGPKRVHDDLTQFTPLVIPGVARGSLSALSHRAVVGQIRRVLRRVAPGGQRPVQLWTFAPDVEFLVSRFHEERCVYYCVDAFSEFEGVDAALIQKRERALMDRADCVLASSAALFESKTRWHNNVHHVPHGVDVEHFARALKRNTLPPEDIADLPRPIIGFFGLLHHWIDVDLIAQTARNFPRASFVMIGSVNADVAKLRSASNVYLLGRRPYASLPSYCAAFDVGMIPFRCNELTRNVNPIKLREYLAAGLPVVSTPLPEVRRYAPDVVIADDAESFAEACRQAANNAAGEHRLQRSRKMAHESWDATVERVSAIVMHPCPQRQAAVPVARAGAT